MLNYFHHFLLFSFNENLKCVNFFSFFFLLYLLLELIILNILLNCVQCAQSLQRLFRQLGTFKQSCISIFRARVLRTKLKWRIKVEVLLCVSFWVVKSNDSQFSFPKAEHYDKDGQEQEAEANHDYNHLHLSITCSQETNAHQSINACHILL